MKLSYRRAFVELRDYNIIGKHNDTKLVRSARREPPEGIIDERSEGGNRSYVKVSN